MGLMMCVSCGEAFYDTAGYEKRDEGTVCSFCIDEEALMTESDTSRHQIDALAKEHAWEATS